MLALVTAVACGGLVDPRPSDDGGFDPDAATISLPREVCGPILEVPAGKVYFGAFSRDMKTGAFSRALCDSLQGLRSATPNRLFTTKTIGLMRTPVTNACYAQCVAQGACSEPAIAEVDWRAPERKNIPVGKVSFAQANAFCAWAGGRLPTIVELTRAAQGDAAYPGVRAMTDAKYACVRGDLVAPGCNRYVTTLLGPRPDHTDHDVDSLPFDTGPFGHHDLAVMATWTRTYLRGSSLSYCNLAEGAPDFVSDPPDHEEYALRLGEFQSTLWVDYYDGPVAAQESAIDARNGIRCAF